MYTSQETREGFGFRLGRLALRLHREMISDNQVAVVDTSKFSNNEWRGRIAAGEWQDYTRSRAKVQ